MLPRCGVYDAGGWGERGIHEAYGVPLAEGALLSRCGVYGAEGG